MTHTTIDGTLTYVTNVAHEVGDDGGEWDTFRVAGYRIVLAEWYVGICEIDRTPILSGIHNLSDRTPRVIDAWSENVGGGNMIDVLALSTGDYLTVTDDCIVRRDTSDWDSWVIDADPVDVVVLPARR